MWSPETGLPSTAVSSSMSSLSQWQCNVLEPAPSLAGQKQKQKANANETESQQSRKIKTLPRALHNFPGGGGGLRNRASQFMQHASFFFFSFCPTEPPSTSCPAVAFLLSVRLAGLASKGFYLVLFVREATMGTPAWQLHPRTCFT